MKDRALRVVDRTVGPPPARTRLTAEYVTAQFDAHRGDPDFPDLLDELFQFGELMLEEESRTTSTVESKATSVLGWTTGLLALFVLQPSRSIADMNVVELALTSFGVFGAFVGLFGCFQALRVRDWKCPSQQDWFSPELFGHPSILRRFHLLSMLETHQEHSAVNAKKVHWLKVAQTGLIGAGASLGLQLIVALGFRLLQGAPTP